VVSTVTTTATTQVISNFSRPTLGLVNAYIGEVGFGSFGPTTVSLDGATSGSVADISWTTRGVNVSNGNGSAF
jgi:hypothetical protein